MRPEQLEPSRNYRERPIISLEWGPNTKRYYAARRGSRRGPPPVEAKLRVPRGLERPDRRRQAEDRRGDRPGPWGDDLLLHARNGAWHREAAHRSILLIARCQPQRPSAARNSRASGRAVWRRDEGRCAFTRGGRRCEERGLIEFHHVRPFEAGGEATEANIQLRCRAHNRYEADLFCGEAFIVRERASAYVCGSVLPQFAMGSRGPAWMRRLRRRYDLSRSIALRC